ncbi:MAG: hypothetical protein EHM72_16715 [Calditrichaeota bacterium]|nr:MAG: hypothetical protein EHM72_16715 [Calditrichota bacterium]
MNSELLERYKFTEESLRSTAFYLSFQTVLELSTEHSSYSQSGNTLELYDNRQTDDYIIPPDCRGNYQYQKQESQRDFIKLFFCKGKALKVLVVRFDPDNLPPIDLEFVENKDGFFALKTNDKGKIVVGDITFACLDGCNSLLLFNAHEHDYFQEREPCFIEWPDLPRIFMIMFAAFIAL